MVSTRAYRSPRREQDAASTRNDIMKAARQLFAEHGYARVTVADIARQARTAVTTVYASAGGKADILNELVGTAVTESDAVGSLALVRQHHDITAAMEVLAHGTRMGNETHQQIIDIMYSAMSASDDAERTWTQGTTQYREVLRDIAAHLDQGGALRPGMSIDRASQILWFCFGIAAWRTLTKECGWSWDDAEQWLSRQAVTMLA